jgi:hypothetical protein
MSHESIPEMKPERDPKPDEPDVFKRFIEERGMTPKQVYKALSMYYDQDFTSDEVLDAEVYELAKMFQDAGERGAPLSVFGDALRKGPERERKDPRTAMIDSFLEYSEKNGITARQFEDAVSIYLNGETSGGTSPEETVYSLAKTFSDYERDKGMTLDMPGKVLLELRRREAAPERFMAFVDGLPTGESDKQALKKILEAEKSGAFAFRYPKHAKAGLPPVGFEIDNDFLALPRHERAEYMVRALEQIMSSFGRDEFSVSYIEGYRKR